MSLKESDQTGHLVKVYNEDGNSPGYKERAAAFLKEAEKFAETVREIFRSPMPPSPPLKKE